MKRTAAKYTSSVLTKMAGFFVTTMSMMFLHMPEPPEELISNESREL